MYETKNLKTLVSGQRMMIPERQEINDQSLRMIAPAYYLETVCQNAI